MTGDRRGWVLKNSADELMVWTWGEYERRPFVRLAQHRGWRGNFAELFRLIEEARSEGYRSVLVQVTEVSTK